jgi:transposase
VRTHLTVPEIAARMGVSAATAKRRIVEWMLGTGSAPMRPGRAYVLTEQEFSAVMEFTRYRTRPLGPQNSEGSQPYAEPVRRRGAYAQLREQLSEEFGHTTPRRGRFEKLREEEREVLELNTTPRRGKYAKLREEQKKLMEERKERLSKRPVVSLALEKKRRSDKPA